MLVRRGRWAAVLISGLLLTACAAPSSHHVGDSKAGLFFDTPWQWQMVDQASLVKAQSGWKQTQAGGYLVDSIVWQSVWGRNALSPAQAFGNQPPAGPILIGMVRKLYQPETAALDADVSTALADLVMSTSTATEGDGLQIVKQQTVSLGDLPGLRQVLSWDSGGETQTLTSVAIVNQTHTRLYWLIGRCADSCTAGEQQQLENVINSMTVKEPKVG